MPQSIRLTLPLRRQSNESQNLARHDDPNYGTGKTVRGNLTSVNRSLLSKTGVNPATLSSYKKYDTLGNLTWEQSASGVQTWYDYTDTFGELGSTNVCVPPGATYAYPTMVTNAASQQTKMRYYSCSGLAQSKRDQNDINNGRLGTTSTYDVMHRLLSANLPDGGQTWNEYLDPNTVRANKLATPDPTITSITYADGLGRTSSVVQSSPIGDVTTKTTYDGLGRLKTQSNPYTGASTNDVTTYTHDALDRIMILTRQDGATVNTTYTGPNTTVTDEASHWRKSRVDAAGRLRRVDEPPAVPPNTPGIAGSGWVAISGTERYVSVSYQCGPTNWCTRQQPDGGTVSITINGFVANAYYGPSSTSDNLAAALASALNTSNSPVTASASGSTVSFTAKTVGAGTNYSLVATSNTTTTFYFSGTSFPVSQSGSALTGGADPGGGAASYTTTYDYDPLNNLLSVHQAGDPTKGSSRDRSFSYDSLSRLISATNPEAGTICYGTVSGGTCYESYDGDGNLLDKTDARLIRTHYDYNDPLHRLKSKTYTDSTPAATYNYDNCASSSSNCLGRVVSDSSNSFTYAYTYDPMGRLSSQTDTTPSYPGGVSSSATYNAAGGIRSLTYPDNRRVSYSYPNAAGWLQTVTDNGSGTQYASIVDFWPAGTWKTANYANGTQQSDTYNPRLQPSNLKLTKGGTVYADRDYSYSAPNCQAGGGLGNNGNVCGITDKVNPQHSQTFTYDPLNRILSGLQADNAFNQQFDIDPWGNLKQNGTHLFNQSFDSSNRVIGWGYDAAGNLTNQPGSTYTWDAEERMTSGNGNSYSYDANGNRARKNTGAWTEYIRFGGNPIAEYSSSGWTDYVFAGGKRIAEYAPSTGLRYYWADHLGSARVMTDSAGTKLCDTVYAPYGQEVGGSPCPTHYKFTGKERDSETQLDYFGARYYGSNMGRWMSPDWSVAPIPIPYAFLRDPQTLNLYGYVRNSPLIGIDFDGHAPIDCGGRPECDREGKDLKLGQCGFAAGGGGACRTGFNLSDEAADFIGHGYENPRDKGKNRKTGLYFAYDDGYGNPTIGYGHKVKPGEDFSEGLTLEQVRELFKSDIAEAVKAVLDHVRRSGLGQEQFDALASLQFNAGPYAKTPPIRAWNLTGTVVRGDFTNHYTTSGGVFSDGLLKRRKAEWIIFSTGVYDASH